MSNKKGIIEGAWWMGSTWTPGFMDDVESISEAKGIVSRYSAASFRVSFSSRNAAASFAAANENSAVEQWDKYSVRMAQI